MFAGSVVLHRRNENGVDILLDPKFLKAGLVQEDVNAIFVATVEHYAPSEHDGMRGVSCKFRRAVGHLGGVPEGMLPGQQWQPLAMTCVVIPHKSSQVCLLGFVATVNYAA